MSVELLAAALAAAGCPSRVEARGRLAVLITDEPQLMADERTRRVAIQLAHDHGFSHLALELAGEADDAAPLHCAESSR